MFFRKAQVPVAGPPPDAAGLMQYVNASGASARRSIGGADWPIAPNCSPTDADCAGALITTPARRFATGDRSWPAVANTPSELIAAPGGLKQQRVRGTINGAEYISNVISAGGGRLALSVSQTVMCADGVSPGDAADFEIERVSAQTEVS